MSRGPLERIDAPEREYVPRERRPHEVDGALPSPWRRGVARVFDMLIVLTVLFMFTVIGVFWFVPELVDALENDLWGRALVPQVLFVILSAVLEVTFLRWSLGQTPGRDRLHVRVVRHRGVADDLVGPAEGIGVGRGLARWAIPGLAMLAPHVWPGLVIVALCGLPVLFGQHRSIPDFVAGTRVVRFDRTAHEVAVNGHDNRPRRRPRFRFLGPLE